MVSAAVQLLRRIAFVAVGTVILGALLMVTAHSVLFPQVSIVHGPTPVVGRFLQSTPIDGAVPVGSVMAFAHDDAMARCTVGAAWRDGDGHLGVVTAGHCMNEGEALPAVMLADGVYRPVGFVTDRVEDATADVAFVRLSVDAMPAPVVRTGEYTTDLIDAGDIPIVGTAPVTEGLQVCSLGATSGLLCRWRVSSLLSRVVEHDGGLVHAPLALGSSDRCVGPGDSGGMVLTFEDGVAKLVGIISASAEHASLPITASRSDCLLLFTSVERLAKEFGGEPVLANEG